MKEPKNNFFCQICGYKSSKWLGRCPSCGDWNTFAEEISTPLISQRALKESAPPVPLNLVSVSESERLPIGMREFDRVLGGGIVAGSATLIGGEPGIGKSTLLLQMAERLARTDKPILYISGEESAKQIKLRGERIGAKSPNILILTASDTETIILHIQKIKPAVVIIDSIQTIYSPEISSAPGSVSQVREASERLITVAKTSDIPIFLVGHVTKDGSLAGPKVLEHMVDTVLYFEGDHNNLYRIVRSMKNRFGPTNEIGVFEMRGEGLAEITNPSDIFLAQRALGVPGSVVVPSMEGSRPILLELQALVSHSNFGIPKRTTIGFDPNRVSLLVAVIDKILRVPLGTHDIFINVAGGIRIEETAADLGIVAAMLSSLNDREISPRTAVFGEVGLAGEVRGVAQAELRVREAARMGFNRCIVPKTKENIAAEVEIIKVGNIGELLAVVFR
ncbi:MAG: DNA repair protein RadA [Deltaproteobacteria bacterium]|nr:DNA repair protein RadA [Deltaproteobacteria bacterium]